MIPAVLLLPPLRRTLVLFVVLPFFLACGQSESRAPEDAAESVLPEVSAAEEELGHTPRGVDTLCVGYLYAHGCAEVIEQHQLQRYPEVVVRDSARLRIRMLSGDWLVLVDSTEESAASVHHYYREYSESIQYHVVSLIFWEGGGYLVINAHTGEQTYLPGPPVVSPDATRFAVTSVDLDAEYDPTTVQIWRLAAEGPELEWRFDPLDVQKRYPPYSTWGLTDATWVSPTELQLRRIDFGGELGKVVRVHLTEDGWVLIEPDA
jgi:hypothetical protein